MNYKLNKNILKIFFTSIILILFINFYFAWSYDVWNKGAGCSNVCNGGGNGNRKCCSGTNWVNCVDIDDMFGPGLTTNGFKVKLLEANSTEHCSGSGNTESSCVDEPCRTINYPTNVNTMISMVGCNATLDPVLKINDTNYTIFATPGSQVKISGISENSGFKEYYLLEVTKLYPAAQNPIVLANSTRTNDNSIKTGKNVCAGTSNGCTVAGGEIGEGNLNEFSHTFSSSDFGGYKNILKRIKYPQAGTKTHLSQGATVTLNDKTKNIYVGIPTLVINGPSDVNTGFYEKFGFYERKIFFNLINPTPLDLNILNYSMNCIGGAGVNCSISNMWIDFDINRFKKMVIYGTIRVDKNYLPKNPIEVVLDVNYNVREFSSNPLCPKIYTASSPPTKLRYGLMDYQKFQVGLRASRDFNGCVGENGIIGKTGTSAMPRVNIGFGGSEGSNAVSIDECDSLTLSGQVNGTWVYCSRKEFLVELAKRIAQGWSASTGDKQKYLSFQTNIRRQSFNKTDINNAINELYTDNFFTNRLGLGDDYGQSTITQKEKIQNLFKEVEFKQLEGNLIGELAAGTYNVNINILLTEEQENSGLFNGNSLDPKIKITVNFSELVKKPEIDWFFYEFGDYDFNGITPNGAKTFKNTNLVNRGEILKYVYNGETNNFNNYIFSPSYAVPVIARLKTGSSLSDTNRTFSVSNSIGEVDKFSYWTGFASSIDDGCTNIVTNPKSGSVLPYREADSVNDSTRINFYFGQLDNGVIKQNQTMYLQTVLFWPSDISNSINITNAKFKIYTKEEESNSEGTINVSNVNNNFKVLDLNSMFEGIKNEKICVHYGATGTRSTSWTIFWNTNSIYRDIQARKEAIINTNKDSQICQLRQILGS